MAKKLADRQLALVADKMIVRFLRLNVAITIFEINILFFRRL